VDSSTVSGNTAEGHGGGIFNQATLNVQNGSTVGGSGAGNMAVENGGGIYNDEGTTTVDGSSVSGNSGDWGGGIYSRATLNVLNGSIIGGAGAANTAAQGGGILNQASVTTLDGSTVSANTTTGDGGGINNRAVLHALNDSVIAANTADGRGGGIFNLGHSMTVDGSTISANIAGGQGGGIYNFDANATVSSSTISANSTGDTGGGICNSEGTTTVTSTRILNNSASISGGGVYSSRNFDGETDVTGSCIVGNSAMSFYNDEPAQQIATGNWWGAATGPNTPGADTVLGNVDVSDHLTAPILGCAPDLLVGKANDTRGNGTVGIPFHWTLTVSNTGFISGTFGGGVRILEDDLPLGPAYGLPAVGGLVDVVNGDHIDCSLGGRTLTCEAAGGDVTIGAVIGRFEVTISATPSAQVTLVNPAGTCQVDPDGIVTEDDESNNNCTADVVDVTGSTIYLPLVRR
jgi:hypothetical protein